MNKYISKKKERKNYDKKFKYLYDIIYISLTSICVVKNRMALDTD